MVSINFGAKKKTLCGLWLFAVVQLAIAPPLAAQLMQKDQGDPRYVVREYFQQALPLRWWASDPIRDPWGWSIDLHIPVGWRGNPASQAMAQCPPPESDVWLVIESLSIRPIWKDVAWASYQCLKR
ncbi:hypothetical protein CKO38_03155 [Rhodospirillum rubrum]|uniref:hypothetical protein n=1 Tax=Rhodospirillum rubrum TaxID=1085 RepID=UPI0019076FC9|nr:hypothetical protein [Rhodospirillum rubrum]MBK1663491.1 hypothetical protein [Rhodospirillum rubrum]MBK1675689.1 hypothetical protein [Rhodospirillum rubrum]